MVLYASGTALNDVFDFESRPARTARVGRCPRAGCRTRYAAWLGGLGLVIGPVLALPSGSIGQRDRGRDPRGLHPGL